MTCMYCSASLLLPLSSARRPWPAGGGLRLSDQEQPAPDPCDASTPRSVVSGSTDGTCRVYSIRGHDPAASSSALACSAVAEWQAHEGNVDGMAALPLGQFASVGAEGALKIWTLKVRCCCVFFQDFACTSRGRTLAGACRARSRCIATDSSTLIIARWVPPQGRALKVMHLGGQPPYGT